MDWLNMGDFLIGLIGLIVGLSPSGRRALIDYWKRREFKRLLGDPGPACIVIPVHPDQTIDRVPRIHRMVKVETTMAALRLRDHLQQLGWEVTIRPSKDKFDVLQDICVKSTMFFLGSTRVTSVATDHFEILKSEFGFEERELREHEDGVPKVGECTDEGLKRRPVIVEKSSGVTFPSPMDDRKPKGVDLALVIKTENRHRRDRSVFWLAGIHAIGTWGATEFLCSYKGLREILSLVGSRDFATVARIEFTGLDEKGHRDPSSLLKVTDWKTIRTPRGFPERRGG